MIRKYLFICLLFLFACGQNLQEKKNITGETMGTTYHISYFGDRSSASAKKSIDSLLVAINADVSTYISTSTISLFNQANSDTVIIAKTKKHFWNNFLAAKRINNTTFGFFDPTVMPLVNYWGFGYKGHRPVENVDSSKVDSMLQYVGFDKVFFCKDSLFKLHPHIQLDFSSCAKGYGVDEVGRWFEQNSIKNYFIEIGGENRARGIKPKGQLWTVGLAIPKEHNESGAYHTVITLNNQSMATSGNYLNFYEVKGQKFSHTINPKTGFSERNTILSASVLADDCLQADALATGIMAMGYKNAKKLYKTLDSVQIILKIGQLDGTIKTEFWGMKNPEEN